METELDDTEMAACLNCGEYYLPEGLHESLEGHHVCDNCFSYEPPYL